MFSKIKFTLACATLVVTVGCGLIGEQGPSGGMQLKSAEVGCLDGASKTFSEYFEGNSSETQVSALWDCFDKSIKLFTERTRGVEQDTYKPQELRLFLVKHFLKNGVISDGLLFRAMELKTALLGGSPDRLTRPELERARELISHLRSKTLRMRHFMPLTGSGQISRSEAEVTEAVTILEEEAQSLGVAIGRANSSYSFESLDALIGEFEGFLPGSVVQLLRKQIPTLKAMKAILVPSDKNAIGPAEWPNTLLLHAKLWGFYLRATHLKTNSPDLLRGEDRKKFLALIHDALDFFERAARRHPEQTISFELLEGLVASLDAPTIIQSAGLSLDSFDNVRKSVRPIVQRFLGGSRFGRDGREASGLTVAALAYFRKVASRWDSNQIIAEKLAGIPFSDADVAKISSGEEQTSFAQYVNSIPLLYLDSRSMSQVTIPIRDEKARSFNDLSQLNTWREVARMLIAGYAEDPKRAKDETAIDVKEIRVAYDHFRDLGIEVKAFDPLDPNVPEKRFAEASVFMYSSDGDDLLERGELTELFALSLTAKMVGESLHMKIADLCYQPGQSRRVDIYGFPAIEPECYFSHLYSGIHSYFAHVPELAQFVSSLESNDKQASNNFKKYFSGISRKSKVSDWVDSGESQAMAALSSYLEAMFSRFDENRSGALSQFEGADAFPLFEDALSKSLCTSNKASLRDAFDFIMTHGEAPDSLTEKIRKGVPWVVGRWFGRERRYSVDRVKILKILYEFSQSKTALATCQP
jgi:hypothetical protein